MSDFTNLYNMSYGNLDVERNNVWVFRGTRTLASQPGGGWQTWHKPNGISMIHILAIAGGGCGGNGQSSSVGGGGGGGSCGNITIGIFPAVMLPRTLEVFAGIGGSQDSGNKDGTPSHVCLDSNTTVNNVLVSTDCGYGGSDGSGGLGGNGGNGSLLTGIQSPFSNGFGQIQFSYTGPVGKDGGAYGADGDGFDLGALVGDGDLEIILTSGTGGGGAGVAGFNGGAFTGGLGFLKDVPGGAYYGNNGSSGLEYWKPLFFTGGIGGGGGTSGTGGCGGKGAFGCGGGGGGGAATGGKGGDGGDGLVIISAW